jgi:hypothetical protein
MIKPKALLLILLFLPYLLWVPSVLLMGISANSVLTTIVAILSVVYAFGIIFWGIPYTTLVLGILFWSRGRSAQALYDVLSRSPILLAWITLAEFVLAYLILVVFGVFNALSLGFGNQIDILELVGGVFGSIFYAFMAMFGIFIYGYIFVFLAKGVYRVFESRNWLKDEENVSLDGLRHNGLES